MSEASQQYKKRMASGLRGTSLPSPLLPSGLGGSFMKRHKTQTKSAWVMEQLTAVTIPTSDPGETDGHVDGVLRYSCNHCNKEASSNKDRLKRHLLHCTKFLASTQALNIAKTFPELAAAIEAYKQENEDVVTTPSSKSTTRAGNGGQRTLCQRLGEADCDCNLPFNIVDNPTFKTFLATWVPAMPVPSRDQLLTAIQADHANLADVHYGLAIVDKWFGDATSAFKFIWSDRRSRLLLGRMWIMSFVFFNTRVMTRKEHHASAEAQEEWESFIAAQRTYASKGAKIVKLLGVDDRRQINMAAAADGSVLTLQVIMAGKTARSLPQGARGKPMDVGCQKPFKDAVRTVYNTWLAKGVRRQIDSGTAPTAVRVNLQLSAVKPLVPAFLLAGLTRLQSDRSLVQASFPDACIAASFLPEVQLEAVKRSKAGT
ncbi:hypothetical protein QJQ45_008594 [Haematococcus lacustris]|nr:hypothetical protein QJQ45_008594 [Haematococcus lacustris]